MYVVSEENYLEHYGRKGMKWGQHIFGKNRTVGKKRRKSVSYAKELQAKLNKMISYSDYTKLQSPEETLRKRSGSCHDQVILELDELRKSGIDAKARFLIEYDPKTGQGGTTHSFVYFNQNGKTYWLENAWGGREGLHEYDSLKDVEKDIAKFMKEERGNHPSQFTNIQFSNFGTHEYGENLQEFVNRALSTLDDEKK